MQINFYHVKKRMVLAQLAINSNSISITLRAHMLHVAELSLDSFVSSGSCYYQLTGGLHTGTLHLLTASMLHS